MDQAVIEDGRTAGIDVNLRFIDKRAGIGFVYTYAYEANTMTFEDHPTRVVDARPLADRFTLGTAGFQLVRVPASPVDFYDKDEVEARYWPEMERWLKGFLGAERVIFFHGLARRDDANWAIHPARNAHLDFPEYYYHVWAEKVLGKAEAERWCRRRFIGLNLWRPIAPVLAAPLAVCDATSLAEGDLVPGRAQNAPGSTEPPRHTYNLAWSAGQRWYYFPHMQPDEMLLLTICDSDHSRVQGAPHSAIDDPTTPPGAAPRESYELRAMAFF